ncbi:MAG TPA: YMGG-like glycine zipper-containing protein, partial [Pyrinomonadaceae bacterium]|nr:YMGG-like glycine zipper-containing protein [Pyrinomonadaceae bacterium]
ANLFRNSLENWTRSSTPAYTSNEDINLTVREFNDSVRRLRDRFDRRQATAYEVQDVLSRASRIDEFASRNTLDLRSQNFWSSMRADLSRLASAYNLTWQVSSYNQSGNTSGYPAYGNQYGVQALTGTYRIDRARSDDARTAAGRAARNLPYSQRARVLDLISRRLDPPEELAIDVRGRAVTMASTRAAQVSFEADGRERIETSPNGLRIRSRAWLSGNQLTVNSTGDRGNEFHVSFQPMENGQTLVVTRRIFAPELNQSVEVKSTYLKTASVARFDVYNQQNATQYPVASGTFVVPDGTRVTGVLDNSLSTRTAAVGDRFNLRVTDPVEFRDATVEGHVSSIQRSGRLTGRSAMTLDFDRIRLRDGSSYQFAGLLERVMTNDGETVRVDTEGAVRDRNQTTRTEERAAIGTAVGAIIGAIAGGGKGAAIGAILGAGAGAGSIYVEGRNELELNRGTELIIRAGAPSVIAR